MPEDMRIADGRLQTAVHHYLHTDPPRRVTVIGTSHFGTPAYWADIRARIDRLTASGAVVQCEGSHLLPDDTDMTAGEQNLLAESRRCRALEQRRVTEVFGWTHQADGLGYPGHWQIIDLPTLEILRRLGPDLFATMVSRKRKMVDWSDTDRRGPARYHLGVAVGIRALGTGRAHTRRGPADPVIVDDRERLTLDRVASTGRDIVLVWGAAHLTGLGTGLREQGFIRCADTEWHTVVDVPPLWPAIRHLILGRPPTAAAARPTR